MHQFKPFKLEKEQGDETILKLKFHEDTKTEIKTDQLKRKICIFGWYFKETIYFFNYLEVTAGTASVATTGVLEIAAVLVD